VSGVFVQKCKEKTAQNKTMQKQNDTNKINFFNVKFLTSVYTLNNVSLRGKKGTPYAEVMYVRLSAT
jgi:hypothetical protein